MLRTECAGCGHAGLTVFADLGWTPLADMFAADAESAVSLPRYPLRAATCDKCGLAQLLDVVDDDLLYRQDYGFRTGGSPSSLAYMADLARFAHEAAPDGNAVEIGCNDGTLLRQLRKLGRITAGVDPSVAAAEIDPHEHLNVAAVPFTADLAGQFGWKGKAALVVAVNVAAHVADPHDFLDGVATLLAPDGVAVVEFQYLPDLLAGCMFDLIYHEHRFFYTVDTFTQIAFRHGLGVVRANRVSVQGGSVRLVLRKGGELSPYSQALINMERLQVPDLLQGFQIRADYARLRIIDTVRDYPGKVYGYAASAKSCTLLNWCELDLPYILDATQSKWGRYAPGSGIPIYGHGDIGRPDAYLLLASNYLSGVLRREQAKGFAGEFIVPLPLPVIV